MKRLAHHQSNRKAIRNPREVLERIRMRRMLSQPDWTDLYCDECLAGFQAQVDAERPGHVWAVDGGKVVYIEDAIIEHHLGRKLTIHETIVHRDGDPLNNCKENLEVVTIVTMDAQDDRPA